MIDLESEVHRKDKDTTSPTTIMTIVIVLIKGHSWYVCMVSEGSGEG